MGGVCSTGVGTEESTRELSFRVNGNGGKVDSKRRTTPLIEETKHEAKVFDEKPASSSRVFSVSKEEESDTVSSPKSKGKKHLTVVNGKSVQTKINEGSTRLGKAVEVLASTSFVHSKPTCSKRGKITILSFEVAKTIVKGSRLMQSLSRKSLVHLKDSVFRSEGVRCLISTDIDHLLSLTATDKKNKLKIFAGEVIRFGNRCKDPRWHNLDRYFAKIESDLMAQDRLEEIAKKGIEYLMRIVQHTSELYNEMKLLDRFEQDYERKRREERNYASQIGDTLKIYKVEMECQKKHVDNLKKKSLWSKSLEEIVEKLVDIVHYLHLEIHKAFISKDGNSSIDLSIDDSNTLGRAGLALHYANIITQIDFLVPKSSSVPPSMRDTLYQSLPPSIKCALRTKLHSTPHRTDELTVAQIRGEMERILRWILPMAENTIKAQHGFGWVGEWACNGVEENQCFCNPRPDLVGLETLDCADKEKTETYIIDLLVLLHHLVKRYMTRHDGTGARFLTRSPVHSPNHRRFMVGKNGPSSSTHQLAGS